MRLIVLLVVLCLGCLKKPEQAATLSKSDTLQAQVLSTVETRNLKPIQEAGETVESRFQPPNGYKRVEVVFGSFEHYLRTFGLKEKGALVYLYNGALKPRQDVHAAVLDISIGHRDLQQCADAIMRLRAEYLYAQKRFNEISFQFTNGFEAAYKKWRSGQRIKVSGRNVSWVDGGQFGVGRTSFMKYLTMVFSYAGTLSLAKEMYSVQPRQMRIGDVFIQGGSPGHAVIVMDLATNEAGDSVFLLAQSYMPAQSIHILNNLEFPALGAWYSLKETRQLVTPEWVFDQTDLKRFSRN